MPYSKEKQAALRAITEAAQLCMAVRSDMVGADVLEKGDKSPVTVADFGSQALVCQRLTASFPGDAIVAEEDATALWQPENASRLAQVTRYVQRFHEEVTAETVCDWIDAGNNTVTDRFWTLDPIDGTKGFLRDDQYAIALALIENGEVQVGALACPALPLDFNDPSGEVGAVFIAVRGEGAAMASLGGGPHIPIQVSNLAEESKLRFVESVESAHGDQPLQAAVARAVGITRPSMRLDSQAKYGAVARGDAALYLRLPSKKHPNYREKIWDHAAGALIVEAAGGRVSDMHGRPLDFASDYEMHNNQGVVVSNGTLHEAVLKVITHPRQNRATSGLED